MLVGLLLSEQPVIAQARQDGVEVERLGFLSLDNTREVLPRLEGTGPYHSRGVSSKARDAKSDPN